MKSPTSLHPGGVIPNMALEAFSSVFTFEHQIQCVIRCCSLPYNPVLSQMTSSCHRFRLFVSLFKHLQPFTVARRTAHLLPVWELGKLIILSVILKNWRWNRNLVHVIL